MPGSTFEQLTVVESHPVALAQCEKFFSQHPKLKRIATEDTAGSVRDVLQAGDRTRAAIAGRRAAEIYGGVILREHLEDNSENYTRFILLSPSHNRCPKMPTSFRSCSGSTIVRALCHWRLNPLRSRDINLMKIESRPVHGRPWQYRFYLDLQASSRDPEVVAALGELEKLAVELRILGSYAAAQKANGANFRNQNQLHSAFIQRTRK